MVSRRSSNWSRRERCGAESTGSASMRKMNTTVAAESARHASSMATSMPAKVSIAARSISPRASILFLGLLIGLQARPRKRIWGHAGPCRSQCHATAPVRDDHDNDHQAQREGPTGNKPGQPIEALGGRFSQDPLAPLLNERLHGEVVGFIAGDNLIEFFQHGGRRRAANMVASSEDLIAVAHAQQALADAFSTLGLLGVGREA